VGGFARGREAHVGFFLGMEASVTDCQALLAA
jgi:hypothetical protein